jgi:hypothetical protein
MDLTRKNSIVLKFFTPQNEIKASCNLCCQSLSYKSSISNLKQHMTRKHLTIKLLPKGSNWQQVAGNAF